jgi:hypothetical protein
MTDRVFYQGIILLQKTFNINPDDQTVDVWKMLMLDLGDEEFTKAVIHLCRTKPKMPPNVVAAIREEIEGDNFSAEEAWQKVLQQISSTGIYGEPKFEDPAITNAVKAIGWKDICNTPNREMGVTRAHFYRTYQACRKRAVLMETHKVIETNLALKKLIDGIGRRMIPVKSST